VGAIIRSLQDLPRKTGFQPVTGAVLLLFALIFVGGFLFTPSLGIDDDWGMEGGLAKTWVQQGRVTNALIELVFPQPVSPLFPYTLLAFSFVAAYAFIIGFHGMKHSWKTSLAFLVFVGFPTNWLIQEFVINIPGIAFALSATTLAAFLSRIHHQSSKATLLQAIHLPSVLLLVVAIGSYQSMVVLYLSLCLGYCVYPAEEDRTASPMTLAKKYVPGFLLSAVSATLLYKVIAQLLLVISGWPEHQIGQYFRSPYFMLRTQPIDYLWGNIKQVFQTYTLPSHYFGGSLFMLPIVFALALIVYFAYPRCSVNPSAAAAAKHYEGGIDNARKRGMGAAVMITLLLASPFLMNIVSAPNRLPMRTLVALPYVAWLFTAILLHQSSKQGRWKLNIISPLLVILLVVQLLKVNSSYFGARYFSQRADYLVASSIVSYTTSHPEIRSSPLVRLATHGSLKREVPFSTGGYSTAPESFFGWDQGSTERMLGYMQMLGISGYQKADNQTLSKLRPAFEQMQPWPAPTSMRVVDRVLLLKLSD
jgi:hypothetical protein